jgi:hypothetical protein
LTQLTGEDNRDRQAKSHDLLDSATRKYRNAAEAHDLYFTVDIDVTRQSVIPQLHQYIVDHFSLCGLTFPSNEDPDQEEDEDDLGSLRWQLLNLQKARGQIPTWRPSVAAGLQADCVDFKRLKKMADSIITVDNTVDCIVLISESTPPI